LEIGGQTIFELDAPRAGETSTLTSWPTEKARKGENWRMGQTIFKSIVRGGDDNAETNKVTALTGHKLIQCRQFQKAREISLQKTWVNSKETTRNKV